MCEKITILTLFYLKFNLKDLDKKKDHLTFSGPCANLGCRSCRFQLNMYKTHSGGQYRNHLSKVIKCQHCFIDSETINLDYTLLYMVTPCAVMFKTDKWATV